MNNDDKEAQRARAKKLREQIKGLCKDESDADQSSLKEDAENSDTPNSRRDAPRVDRVSPRDFIHQRMREMDDENE